MVKFEWDEDKNESNIEKHGWILKMLPKFLIARCLSRSIHGKIMVKTVGLVLVCWSIASFPCERRCNMKDSTTKSSSATDWERIDKLTDEQIDTSDIPPLNADFFARATLQMPSKSTVVLSVDADVLEWFQSQGEKSKERMNAALRIYAEAHKQAA